MPHGSKQRLQELRLLFHMHFSCPAYLNEPRDPVHPDSTANVLIFEKPAMGLFRFVSYLYCAQNLSDRLLPLRTATPSPFFYLL